MSSHSIQRTVLERVGVAVLSTALAACGASTESFGVDSISVSYSSPVGAQPSQQSLIQGFKAGAKQLGWGAEVIDANLSADAQVSNVQTMIQKHVDAIGLWTLDPGAMEGTFAQAADADIPVIGVNSPGKNVDSAVWWALFLCDTDDAPYKVAASQLAKVRPAGNVIVIGGPPVPSIQANVACFTEAAKAVGLKIIAQVDNTKDTSAAAATLAADLLAKHRDIDAVWAYNDASALGVSSAATHAGLKISDGTSPGVIIQGTNGDPDAIEAIRQGRLTGTWDPNAVATGMAVIQAMKDAMDGVSGKTYTVKSTYYDASNIGDYVTPEDQSYELKGLHVTLR